MRVIYPGILPTVCLLLAGMACTPRVLADQPDHRTDTGVFPYQLDRPHAVYQLPRLLQEASAVCYINHEELGLVEDERGRIYFYSLPLGRITGFTRFAADADYEGLAIVNDTAYALNSNGILRAVHDYRRDRPRVEKIRTPLGPGDDAEGLTHDPVTGLLLLLGKEPPRVAGDRKDTIRAVYSLSPAGGTRTTEAFLVLDMNEVKQVYQVQADTGTSREQAGKFQAHRRAHFKPSDLAIHPATGHLYIIAARGQLLVVADRQGRVRHVRHLPEPMFPKPEGISFSPRGEMFIVNEAVRGRARLLRFLPMSAD